MRRRLDDSTPREELIRIQKSAATYDAKNPDTDCEVKLSGIAWPKETIVIYMGRLITGKGVHALVAAMPSILQRLPDARLLIVGHGPLRESLESMLWALQGGQRVLFKNIAAWAIRLSILSL